jgi:hypothetical protein
MSIHFMPVFVPTPVCACPRSRVRTNGGLMMEHAGKHALVTGGGTRLAKNSQQFFGSGRTEVTITGRPEKLEEVAATR